MKKGTEIPTIDVALVTIKTYEMAAEEIALNTSNQIAVTIATEDIDAVKLIVKEKLIAQKPAKRIVTGNTIVITDNVFNPELTLILQGGTIIYDATDPTKIIGYHPPKVGETANNKIFELNAYSAIYDAGGVITGYERISYPNCQGVPISLSSQDGVFRAPEYTINSAASAGESPYEIEYVADLPPVQAA